MSLDASRWAWGWARRRADLTPPALLVLLYLADLANDDGECWPSLSTIARETKQARSTVKKALNELEQAGAVERDRGHKGKSTRYILPRPGDGQPRPGDGQPRPGDGQPVGRETAPIRSIEPTMTQSGTKDARAQGPGAAADRQTAESVSPPSHEEAMSPSKTPPVPEGIDPQAWADFAAHRRTIRKPLTPRAAQIIAQKLAKLPPCQQRACIELSIERGWTGLFPANITRQEDRYAARSHPRRETETERRASTNAQLVADGLKAAAG